MPAGVEHSVVVCCLGITELAAKRFENQGVPYFEAMSDALKSQVTAFSAIASRRVAKSIWALLMLPDIQTERVQSSGVTQNRPYGVT